VLVCRDVSVTYRQNGRRATPLQSASLEIGANSVAVMGPSGSGKSTLLRVLAGLQKPDRGDVFIENVPLGEGRRAGGGDGRACLIHQDYRLVEFLTVAENLALAAELRSVSVAEADLSRALERVGLKGFEDRSPVTLSGGEQQRVAIARALVTRCSVLLADEPTGALDEENTRIVARLLRDLSQEQQMSVLVATHDRAVAATMDRVLLLNSGSLIEAGEPAA
jgi:ABC-type lipoprotein export system ATPase subunit